MAALGTHPDQMQLVYAAKKVKILIVFAAKKVKVKTKSTGKLVQSAAKWTIAALTDQMQLV